ncbi:unnamed protein product [Rotaria sordida]|uniref:EF-hand domain-containing protein n=1 Tax=Rotaria sordida TaxID=392033 RepID=A0A818P922_9BILA|nr:unnamed protein product [Rotaria sordida]
MSNYDTTCDLSEQVDTSGVGTIDKSEFRKWVSNTEGLPSSSYVSSTSDYNLNDYTTSRFDRDEYKCSRQSASDYTIDKYGSYGTTTIARELIDDTVIHTNSLEETNEYLERSGHNIYKDPNPQIIRRATTETPITCEQRVTVRYLQPPPVPELPLIIKEVRPAQPPPPRPLIIRQHASLVSTPPPLILRERPPTPPKYTVGETVTRYLPEIPVPPRSVVIERLPPLREKPRDIIIERWLPYRSLSQRRTIVERAPPAIIYPEPRNTTIIYDAAESRIVRKFEKLGVVQENPADYIARYGTSLVDSVTLVQLARNAGVTEDISVPAPSSSIYTSIRGNTIDFDRSNETITRGCALSGETSREGLQRAAGTRVTNLGNASYSSSTSNLPRDSALAASDTIIQG